MVDDRGRSLLSDVYESGNARWDAELYDLGDLADQLLAVDRKEANGALSTVIRQRQRDVWLGGDRGRGGRVRSGDGPGSRNGRVLHARRLPWAPLHRGSSAGLLHPRLRFHHRVEL